MTATASIPPDAEVPRPRLPKLSRLAALLYPFAAGAVAINLFLLGLMGQWLGLPALSPVAALCLGVPLGIPAAFAFARWVRGLIAEAGGL